MELDFYTYKGSPNTEKVAIMLAETGIAHRSHPVDITKGDQQTPEFLARNPNNKVPVITDPATGISYVESGAILLHLAARSGRFLPEDGGARQKVLEWLFFQAAHVGPTLGQLWNYKTFISEPLPTVVERFTREAVRVLGVLDQQLARTAHIAGDEYSIADMMIWPWVRRHGLWDLSLTETPHLARWVAAIAERPAVRAALAA